jgi:hypothetical protein
MDESRIVARTVPSNVMVKIMEKKFYIVEGVYCNSYI